MNKVNVLNVAKSIFSNIQPINDNVFKGELFVNSNKPAGVFYFDFTENIDDINFNEYQEKILSEEYFKVRNNLQWNYYYLFFQDRIDKKKKNEIERNDKYARKYIFTESEFIDFFKLENSSSQINSDIIIEWKKKLDEVDLQEVYSNNPVAPSVERFLENNSLKNIDSINIDSNSANQILKVDRIKSIELKDTYRPFPLNKEFKFGKVNLIKGINGVGKTSLFEAIEMLLCGKTKRNPDKNEPDYSVEAVFYTDDEVIELRDWLYHMAEIVYDTMDREESNRQMELINKTDEIENNNKQF